eukprot:UN31693
MEDEQQGEKSATNISTEGPDMVKTDSLSLTVSEIIDLTVEIEETITTKIPIIEELSDISADESVDDMNMSVVSAGISDTESISGLNTDKSDTVEDMITSDIESSSDKHVDENDVAEWLEELEEQFERHKIYGTKSLWECLLNSICRFDYENNVKKGSEPYVRLLTLKAGTLQMLNRFEEFFDVLKKIEESINNGSLDCSEKLKYQIWITTQTSDYYLKNGQLVKAEETIDDGEDKIKKILDNAENEKILRSDSFSLIRSKIREQQGALLIALQLCKSYLFKEKSSFHSQSDEEKVDDLCYYVGLLTDMGGHVQAKKVLKKIEQYDEDIWKENPKYLMCKLNVYRLLDNVKEVERLALRLMLKEGYKDKCKKILTDIQKRKPKDFMWVVDAEIYGNHARFINSSENPNVYFAPTKECSGSMSVYSSKIINKDEEVLADYDLVKGIKKNVSSSLELPKRSKPWENVTLVDQIIENHEDKIRTR